MSASLSEKKAQIEQIKNGKGIAYIIDAASKILENPILIHDMEYLTVAYTDNPVKDDPIWNAYEETGTIGIELLEFIRDECFMDVAANAKKITFLLSEKLKYDRIYGKLFTRNNVQIGCAVIVECCHKFEEDCPILFELVCDKLTKELSASAFFQNYGQKYQEILISKILDGEITDKPLYAAHVESLYIGLKTNLYLALITGESDFEPAHVRDMFLRLKSPYKYCVYGKYVVALLSTDEDVTRPKTQFAPLFRMLRLHGLYAGISAGFDSMFDLQKHYEQAERVLRDRQNASGGELLFMC